MSDVASDAAAAAVVVMAPGATVGSAVAGTIKVSPSDFVVDEIPAYTPSGEGAHRFLRLRKVNRTTDDVVRELASVLGIDRRDIGVAGLKDKVAVTTQWVSVPASARTDDLHLDGVEVLESALHGNKLKTGHLAGNRFRIVVREVGDADALARELARIGREGVPNAFGVQRFGREGDTHERARQWLRGQARAPRDPRQRRFEFSALQSSIFNAVLAARVEEGSWNIPLAGDVMQKEASGGLFLCTDVQQDRARCEAGEIVPTGPIVGDRMRAPEGEALALEQRLVGPLIEGIDLKRARSLGEGTRRALRLRVTELWHRRVDSLLDEGKNRERLSADPARAGAPGTAIELEFVLPRGAYATTVLGSVLSLTDASRAIASPTASGDALQTKNEEE